MNDINVTPLVDVMLVLLIVFMVTAPMLVAGVPVDLPESKAASLEPDQEPLSITLDSSGALFIDDEPVSAGELPARLAAIAASGADASERRVYVRADAVLGYGRVMAVIGEVTFAGFRKVALISEGANGVESPT
jgi:biopolymer transport protein TolR